jgi:heptaprenyl diphosphate synthase
MSSGSRIRKMTTITMLLAMSIVFHMIEPVIPLPVPGVKLGLANIFGLIALFLFGVKEMLGINFMRVLIASLLRGIIFGTGFWLSLTGVALSSFIVVVFYRYTKLSIVGLSVAAAAFHNIGQILAITLIWASVFLIYWLPPMIWLSIPTGILTGTLAKEAIRRVDKSKMDAVGGLTKRRI